MLSAGSYFLIMMRSLKKLHGFTCNRNQPKEGSIERKACIGIYSAPLVYFVGDFQINCDCVCVLPQLYLRRAILKPIFSIRSAFSSLMRSLFIA